MNPIELDEALDALGHAWGLGRKLFAAEIGRACRMGGRDPGREFRENYLTGKRRLPGPLSACIQMMLAGASPPDGIENVIIKKAVPEGYVLKFRRRNRAP